MGEKEQKNEKKEDLGFYYYPQRRETQTENENQDEGFVSKTWKKFLHNPGARYRCITNVHECIRKGIGIV